MTLRHRIDIGVGIVLVVLAFARIASAAPPQVAGCAGCHGVTGMGNPASGFPALAGLRASYIEQQLFAFKHGSRVNAIMKGIAQPLNAPQRAAIGRYYAAMMLPSRPEPSPLPGGEGAVLAIDGAWMHTTKGVPACDSCHGPFGLGVGTAFPRLAGQPASYLAAQLDAWRQGTRNNDPLHLMRNIARQLTPAQITAVAAYYASLSANPPVLPEPGTTSGEK